MCIKKTKNAYGTWFCFQSVSSLNKINIILNILHSIPRDTYLNTTRLMHLRIICLCHRSPGVIRGLCKLNVDTF